jgi:hypothetical protein
MHERRWRRYRKVRGNEGRGTYEETIERGPK